LEREPLALSARYDRRRKRVVIELNNGCTFMFPPELAQGLAGASAADLSDVRVLGPGTAIAWNALDTHFSVTGLLAGRFGNDAWMARSNRAAAPPPKPPNRPPHAHAASPHTHAGLVDRALR
jgi:Protein of unknown function (DUF2442)